MGRPFTFQRIGSYAGPVRTVLLVLALFIPAQSLVMAQKGRHERVVDSILGVHIGDALEDVRKKIEPLSTAGRREQDKERDERRNEDEDEGGRKLAWTLKSTIFKAIALKTDSHGRVVWVTGFLRPGNEIPFAKLGDMSLASGHTDAETIWNVTTRAGGYRLVAKGRNSRASVIYLLSLAEPMQP